MIFSGQVPPAANTTTASKEDSAEFMPIETTKTKLGSESISGMHIKTPEQTGVANVSVAQTGESVDEKIRDQRAEFFTVIAVIITLVLLAAFFYSRSGQRNFAGQGSNRN